MSITERKNKDGTISFKIEASNGYKINHNGNYVQVRKYKTFKQPKNMGLREARKIAKELEIEFQRQFERDQNTGVEMRLEEVWKSYEKFYAPNMLRDTTFYYLKNIAEIKILPELGHLKIGQITTNRITVFLNDIAIKRDKKTGKPLKPKQYYKDSYVQSIYSVLTRILNYAISNGWIKENPCYNAIKPRKNPRKKLKPLEIDQIKDILKKTSEYTTYNAIIQFQIYTGMRIGETLALTWDDIDFKNREININKTVNYTKDEFIVGPPKTENSYRTLGMNNSIYNLLQMTKKEQNERKHQLKNKYEDHNLVFSQVTGNYIFRTEINNRLRRIKKGTDYEYITVHFLRHANATLLLNNGVDIKIVSSHLGHNDIKTTANIYADVLKSQKQKVAQIIEFNLEDNEME